MKKNISILLFISIVSLVFWLFSWQRTVHNNISQRIQSECTSLPSREFASERTHALIVREKTVASIRLANEKNFSPPGGHIEENETPKQALIRELKEELGLSVESRNLGWYKTYCEVIGTSRTQRTYVYTLTGWKGSMNPARDSQLKWVSSDFRYDPTADSELIKTLSYAVKDGLIY